MFTRWLTYARLGLLDLVRLWPATQNHVIIVAGICLPLALLLGLKRGQVESMLDQLRTSATGREIGISIAHRGEMLTLATLAELDRLPGVEMVIPTEPIGLTLWKEGAAESGIPATCLATRPGDPFLRQLGGAAPAAGSRGLVVSAAVAEAAGLAAGDRAVVRMARNATKGEESATVSLDVVGVVPTPNPKARLVYADLGVAERFNQYSRRHGVPEFGWPGSDQVPPALFQAYLAFCPRDKDFTPRDLDRLRRRFQVEDVTAAVPEAARALFRPGMLEKLKVWKFRPMEGEDALPPPWESASYRRELTQADEILIGWNEPLAGTCGGQPVRLVGVNHQKLDWLVSDTYLRAAATPSESGGPFRYQQVLGEVLAGPAELPLEGGHALALEPVSATRPEGAGPSLAVVPAEALAWAHRQKIGRILFDPVAKEFAVRPRDTEYRTGRAYARTVEDVEQVVERLKERGYGVDSQVERIREIHQHNDSLLLLVYVVGAGAFGFGVFTVFSVLRDSTDRKRGTIGILRVMGASGPGIFVLIFLRAALIGLLACVLCTLLAGLTGAALNWAPAAGGWAAGWKPVVAVRWAGWDVLAVLGGVTLCCLAGAVLPAWSASRLDPFDAIVEGRFR